MPHAFKAVHKLLGCLEKMLSFPPVFFLTALPNQHNQSACGNEEGKEVLQPETKEQYKV